MIVTCTAPWLSAELGAEHEILSWAPHRGGLIRAREILWRAVRDADLPPDLDVTSWLTDELRARNAEQALCFLTSRDVSAHHHARAEVEGLAVEALATAGLSNAEAVGTRLHPAERFGTINIAVQIHAALTLPARLEALSIATEARTAAVLATGLRLATGLATGTGTDCIALACRCADERDEPLAYAGLHTALGEAIGAAVGQATAAAAARWCAEWRALGRIGADGTLRRKG